MEHKTRPEAQIQETLAKIAELLHKDPLLGTQALRAWARMHGLDPEEALALAQSGEAPTSQEASPSPVPEAPVPPPFRERRPGGHFCVATFSSYPPKGG